MKTRKCHEGRADDKEENRNLRHLRFSSFSQPTASNDSIPVEWLMARKKTVTTHLRFFLLSHPHLSLICA